MRRVNIKTGIKQRIQDILGSGDNSEGTINAWSIQSAMISNAQRVAKGIVGEADNGRIMRGLLLTKQNSNFASIGYGYGFTPEGNVVYLNYPISNIPVSDIVPGDGTVYFYLKHILSAVSADFYDFGLNTSFNNQTANEDIVFDDSGYVAPYPKSYPDPILERFTEPRSKDEDGYLYIGSATVVSGLITSVTPSVDIGIIPASGDSFIVDRQLLTGLMNDTNVYDIELPTGYNNDNSVILSLKLKNVGSSEIDVFPTNEWIIVPCSKCYIPDYPGMYSVTADINCSILFASDPCVLRLTFNKVYNAVGPESPTTTTTLSPEVSPTFDNVEYQLVIGKLSI